jgi:hypothetical protein
MLDDVEYVTGKLTDKADRLAEELDHRSNTRDYTHPNKF